LSGSATCGPSNVSRLTVTPLKSWAAPDAAVLASAVAEGAGATDAGAVEGVDPVQAEAMKIAVIAAATERYRDTTGDPPLAVVRSVQHIGQMAVGWTLWYREGISQGVARGSVC
jgi:hypothetical protein